MSLFSTLFSRTEQLSSSSKYTVYNGHLYALLGLTLLIWPGILQTVFMDKPYIGQGEILMRFIGALVALIGWMYLFGGYSNSKKFVACTIFQRIFIVPPVLIIFAHYGMFPHLLYSFTALELLLAIVGWTLLKKA